MGLSESSYLDSFVRSAFPNAQVKRHPYNDQYEVRLVISARELLGERDATLRKVATALRPTFRPRRRLWWGRKH